MGGDAVDQIPVFMKNDQINHIHFRNVVVEVAKQEIHRSFY